MSNYNAGRYYNEDGKAQSESHKSPYYFAWRGERANMYPTEFQPETIFQRDHLLLKHQADVNLAALDDSVSYGCLRTRRW